MKKIIFLLFLFTQQAHAVIVNYSCFISKGSEKRKIHLFSDMHLNDSTVTKQQLEVIKPFLLSNHDAIFYVDGYHEKKDMDADNLKKKLQDNYRMLIEMLPQLKAKYPKYSQETILDFLKDSWLLMPNAPMLNLIERIANYSLSILDNVSKFLLQNHISIKNDARHDNANYNGSEWRQDPSFDAAMLNDCMEAEQDIIIIAGVAHTSKLEEQLSDDHKFDCVLKLSNALAKITSIGTEKIQSLKELTTMTPFTVQKERGISLIQALNFYLKKEQLMYHIFESIVIPSDLLIAAIDAADDLAELKIIGPQPLL